MAIRTSILAIGAHPDDVEIGCGGALAKHAALGDAITILTLTRGAIAGDSARRTQESQRAAEILGANLIFSDFDDGSISDGVDTITVIERAIKASNATHIYTHSLQDTHQDHRSVYYATMAAARHVSNLYSYLSPSSTSEFCPNYFIDIAEYIDTKLALIAAHQSQTTRRNNLEADLIVATARYWGRFANYGLVEAMRVIRQCN